MERQSSEEPEQSNSDDMNDDYKSDGDGYMVQQSKPKKRKQFSGPKKTAWNSPTGRIFMALYNDLRAFQEVYNVQISVPMFCFLGFQSSGKTSAVSQAAQMVVGVMKDGTASRCPVRFKLINDPNTPPENKVIYVKGRKVKDEIGLVKALLDHGKELEQKGGFSEEIVEVSIQSSDVPQLTFVDLPGLLKKDDDPDREKLDRLTAKFINDIGPDGTPNYIPIFVRPAVDIELDDDDEITHIDRIVRQYGSSYNRKTNWQDDALFVVNKFDRVANMSTAEGLCKLIEHSCRYGKRTVITVLNPNGLHKTSRMEHKELNAFVKQVPELEREFWEKQCSTITEDTENIPRLKNLIRRKCGVNKMNEIIAQTMVDIVKKTLPGIENKLEEAEQAKVTAIKKIEEQLKFCNPSKLKTKISDFSSKFLENLRKYYKGELADDLQGYTRLIKRQTWIEEMVEAQKVYSFKKNREAVVWAKQYELSAEALSKICNECGDNELKKLLKYGLNGSKQIERQLYVWRALVALMPFPNFSDETIVNMSNAVGLMIQADPWINARNLVLNAVTHLKASCEWLAEILRYKLLENADALWLYTFYQMFGDDDEGKDDEKTPDFNFNFKAMQSNASIISNNNNKSSKDRKKKRKKKRRNNDDDDDVDNNGQNNISNANDIDDDAEAKINEAKKNAQTHRNGMKALLKRCLEDYKKQAHVIIDEFRLVAQVVPRDLAEVMDKQFLQTMINVGVFTKEELKEFEHKVREYKVYGKVQKKKKKNKKNAPVKQNKKAAKKVKKKAKKKGNNNDSDSSDNSSSEEEVNYFDDDDDDDTNNNNSNNIKKKGNNIDHRQGNDEIKRMDDDDDDDDDDDEYVSGVDKFFFKYVYSSWAIKGISLTNQPDAIRGLAKIYWIGIKSFVIRDIVQKYTNRIMSTVRQHDSKFANAVTSGVETRKIRDLIGKLADITQISNNELDDFVKNNAPAQVMKDVKDFGDEEIMKAYGVDAKALMDAKQAKLKDLKEFRESKNKWMKKIAMFKVRGYN